jgi:hypothetical protein
MSDFATLAKNQKKKKNAWSRVEKKFEKTN